MAMTQNPKTLTAANSIVLFKAEGYFDTAIRLEGYQADNAFTYGDATMAETVIGVDGKQSGGWVAHEVPVTIHLLANSPSRAQMEQFRAWLNSRMETTVCTIDVTIPATGVRSVATGFLTSVSGGTSAQKLLQGTQYVFTCTINGEDAI